MWTPRAASLVTVSQDSLSTQTTALVKTVSETTHQASQLQTLAATCLSMLWSAVAQLVECRTRNRESPGSNPRCYRFEVWAFSFTSRRLSRLSCINEYLAIDIGGNVSE